MINDENDTRTILEETTCEKDLGLHVDNQLLFDDHIHQACKKANNIMGAIRRTFKHLDIPTLPLLYKAMVRPILEYGNTAGYPHLIRQANKIEQVQRRATKLIPSLTNLPYEQRLKKLNLPSIAFRQLHGDMIQVYKYLSRKYNTPPLDSLQCAQDAPHLHSTRGHQYKLTKLRSNSAPQKHFFTFRVVNDWNSLTHPI